jgi:hypothetical protein
MMKAIVYVSGAAPKVTAAATAAPEMTTAATAATTTSPRLAVINK